MGYINLKNEGIKIEYLPNETLLTVLQRAGINLDAACGGQGKCGKCRLRVEGLGEVLACRTPASDGMKVDTSLASPRPENMQILTDSSVHDLHIYSRHSLNGSFEHDLHTRPGHILNEEDHTGLDHKGFDDSISGYKGPMLRYVRVPVEPCPPGKSISDWTRLKEGIHTVFPDRSMNAMLPEPDVVSAIGPELRESLEMRRKTKKQTKEYTKEQETDQAKEQSEKLSEDQAKERAEKESEQQKSAPLSRHIGSDIGFLYTALVQGHVLRVSADPFPVYMAAFDIGTTTVAGYLLCAQSGATVATASCMNPQTRYGADVISRANYALEHEMEPLFSCIRQSVDDLLTEMADRAGIKKEDIYLISIAGNTCMHHLFLGISPDSLVHAPYNPAISDPMLLRAADYGLHVYRRAVLAMLPNIAGFVGADTVSCLVSSRLAEQTDWTLLIDIGTNGEMVLGRNHRMMACSTAAGPAFEGAGISCGMRGTEGAISRAVWKEGQWSFDVIGGGKIRGICGSGLLDITAQLLISGQMDETGDMDMDDILLSSPEESATGQEIRLIKKDIRQLQLAKAAIATGVKLLAEKMGIELEEIRQVWLAGAFGSFLSPDSACIIGMIPPQLRGRIVPIGNAAGEGAKDVLLKEELWTYAAAVAREVEFLELATMPAFNDTFIDEIMFPSEE